MRPCVSVCDIPQNNSENELQHSNEFLGEESLRELKRELSQAGKDLGSIPPEPCPGGACSFFGGLLFNLGACLDRGPDLDLDQALTIS